MEWLALPPEINSARLIAGAGAVPLQTAAGAYSMLSVQLSGAAMGMTALMASMASQWVGPTSVIAMSAFSSYVSWIHATSAQLASAAGRAQAQAAAYVAAVAAMPPLPVIETNQATGITLASTNVMGVNTAPLAANEAAYMAMWVQAAVVMSSYAAATAANAVFDPFMPAPPIVGIGVPSPLVAQTAMAATLTPLKDAELAAAGAQAGVAAAITEIAMPVSAAMEQGVRADNRAQAEEGTASTKNQARAQAMLAQAQMVLAQAGAQAQQISGQVAGVAGQVGSGVQSVVSPAAGGISQMSNFLMQRLDGHPGVGALTSPGLAGAVPISPVGFAMATGGAMPGASMRFAPSISGMSGAAAGFRMPTGWASALSPTGAGQAPALADAASTAAESSQASAAGRAMGPAYSGASSSAEQPVRRRAAVEGARIMPIPVVEHEPAAGEFAVAARPAVADAARSG